MKQKTKKGWFTHLTELLCAALVLLCPMVITAGLAMLQVLCLEQTEKMPGGLAIFCTIVVMLLWWGTAVLTKLRLKTRLFHGSMPKTGLILSGMLVLSVLFAVVAFAMEQDVIELMEGLWALSRLLGTPAMVSVTGVQELLSCEYGTAMMLTCGVFLLIGFIAALPVSGTKEKKVRKAIQEKRKAI